MRILAGAIIVLAGAVALGAGAIAADIHGTATTSHDPPMGALSMLAGAGMGIIGLAMVFIEGRAGYRREYGLDRPPDRPQPRDTSATFF